VDLDELDKPTGYPFIARIDLNELKLAIAELVAECGGRLPA
jgi:hypothetical protein